MMYADTSFLFSLVLHDSNTKNAVEYLKKSPIRLVLTAWQRCELQNAVRLSVWRGNCTTVASTRALERIAADVRAGDLVETDMDWPLMLACAEQLGAKHTSALGVRSLDLLHVATAVTLGAKVFLTCDERQLALARAAGLKADKA